MNREKQKIVCLLLTAVFCCLTGCGGSRQGQEIVMGQYYNPNSVAGEEVLPDNEGEDTEEEEKETKEPGTDLFMIISNNMQTETLVLKQIVSGKQYMYNYSVVTRFLDKYGNRTTASNFASGRCMTVLDKDIQGKLMEAKLSDTVWEYPDVTRYSVDEERGIFKVADMKYSYDDGLFVNSDGEDMELSEISDIDTVRLVGIGKRLLSVSVTTGHGALQLKNTEIFEGSFIQIGDKIFSEITKDMLLEIPEGTYTVTVANNGYGGSTEVTIARNETLELDLDTLKGEGPQFGRILFAVDVPNAILMIDGEAVDYSEPLSLQYGVHSLTVMADSYETYSKKLFVNSKEATVIIGLDKSSTTTANTTRASETTSSEGTASKTNNTAAAGRAGSLAGSLAGSKAGSSAAGADSSTNPYTSGVNAGEIDESITDAALGALLDGGSDSGSTSSSDYISTLTELLKILTDKK